MMDLQQFLYNYFLILLNIFNHITVFYFFVVNGIYLLMIFIAFFSIKNYLKKIKLVQLNQLFHSPFSKPISIIVPAHNEEKTIVSSVAALLQLRYPNFEVIVVNDGSRDQTLTKLAKHFDMIRSPKAYQNSLPCSKIKGIYVSTEYPNLIMVNKAQGGKADALNAGINASSFPLFCAIDADSILEPDAILKVIRAFVEDRHTVAAGGTIRIANGCTFKQGFITKIGLPDSLLGKFQILEYLRSFLAGRVAYSALNSLLIVSGAFGIFKKSTVIQVGGFKKDAIGEDMDLIVRLHRHLKKNKIPYKIVFVPEPVCWTEAPETLEQLGKQRIRWQRGLLESLSGNMEMLFNSQFGFIGLVVFPFLFFVEGLSCFLELAGVVVFIISWFFDLIDEHLAILFVISAVILNIFLSLGAILFEEFTFKRYPSLKDVMLLWWLSFFETFLYRPFTTWWRVVGTWKFFFRAQGGWGQMERQGFKTKKE